VLELEKEDRIRLKKGEKAAKYSSVINLLLAIIKGIVGFLSGSIVLIADSIHSFSDIIASLAVYIGLKLSMRKPDEKFPYGYYKIETFASLLVSAIIIITGIEIASESYNIFLNPNTIGIPLIALFVAALSALVSFLLAKYKHAVGIKIGSQALISDGKHSFIDIFSSIIVFVGILSSYLGYIKIQGISGVLIAFLIVYMGLKLAKDDVLVLLDANLDPKTISEIKSIVEGIDGVQGVHNIKVRRSGPFIFAELHLETKKELPVKKASKITKNIQKAVKNNIKNLDNLSVQIEPSKMVKLRVAVPVENKKGLQSKISEHLAKAPYILIVDLVSGKITDTVIKENPGTKLKKKKGIKTAEFLGKEKVDILVAKEIGEGSGYVLSDNLIDVTIPEGRNLVEIITNAYTLIESYD
jgi:cation diffusion facilitator family transporter